MRLARLRLGPTRHVEPTESAMAFARTRVWAGGSGRGAGVPQPAHVLRHRLPVGGGTPPELVLEPLRASHSPHPAPHVQGLHVVGTVVAGLRSTGSPALPPVRPPGDRRRSPGARSRCCTPRAGAPSPPGAAGSLAPRRARRSSRRRRSGCSPRAARPPPPDAPCARAGGAPCAHRCADPSGRRPRTAAPRHRRARRRRRNAARSARRWPC